MTSVGSRRFGALLALVAASALIVVSCGSRTGLVVDLPPEEAGIDAETGADVEAGPDVRDATPEHDADAEADADGGHPTCTPRTCAELHYDCGPNGDGCGGILQCGACVVPQFCGGGGQFSVCGGGWGLGPDGAPLCTPKNCLQLGFNCGPAGDGCGGLLQCGFCQYPDVCGGGGTPGHCGNSLPCTNLCMQQVVCDSGSTTVTGTVVAGTLPQFGAPDPIYNALVYVPNSAVKPFTPGVQCSQCGADVSGEPLVATQTAPDGTFTLENMPVGANIPLVIQLGRWRRQITIPNVAACTNTPIPATLTRMPRNKSEGDIPLTAVATGTADQTECVLWKMGIDQAEFTVPSGGGRVQVYVSDSGAMAGGSDVGPGTPPASQLWSNPANLANYDIVVLPCEGSEIVKSQANEANLVTYANDGGRIFTTHYGYTWLFDNPAFSGTAQWTPMQMGPQTVTAIVDTGFQKGMDLATWLQVVGALSGPDRLVISNARQDMAAVNMPAQEFLHAQAPLQFAFQTPITQKQQCGRVVYTDFHVSMTALSNMTTFPTECPLAPMTPQEKQLEFMLFDLASCVPPAPQNCTPLTCAQEHIACGPAGDGCGGELMCGPCPAPQTCGGGMVYGQCGYPDAGHCIPLNCQQMGYNCGMNGDGCGNLVDCGTCVSPQICGGGGKPSVCGP